MSKKIARIKIALNGIVPQIYRRAEVPLDFSLRDLHFTIQDAMPWKCSHLYEFEIGEMSYGDPHPPNDPHGFGMIDAASKKLASLIKSKGDRFLYTYDIGDNWRHRIIVEKVFDPDPKAIYPRLIGGKRQAPPDDVGGIWGYEEYLKIMSDPKHPEYEDWQDWFDEDFDREEFDSERIGWIVGNQGTKRAFESLENVRIPRYLSGRGKKSRSPEIEWRPAGSPVWSPPTSQPRPSGALTPMPVNWNIVRLADRYSDSAPTSGQVRWDISLLRARIGLKFPFVSLCGLSRYIRQA